MISTALRDQMSAEFTKLVGGNGQPILPPEGASMQDWEHQTFLASGSLLAKGCQSAMILANHSDVMQNNAYEFGKQIAYTRQVRYLYL